MDRYVGHRNSAAEVTSPLFTPFTLNRLALPNRSARHALCWVSLLLAGCADGTAAPRDDREQLMDRIEASAALPDRASPLSAYGRYYASLPEGRVMAVYLIPPKRPDPAASCWTGGRPCTEKHRKDVHRRLMDVYDRHAKPGERRWVDDVDALPQLMDGGCQQVTIQYDIAMDEIIRISCNGRG
jgi:hypothetical protein